MPHVQPAALTPGSRIAEYEVVRVLGAGGFGITYLAFDHRLDGPVALKEYFPAEVATRVDGSRVAATATANRGVFAWGLDRFLREARAIHQLRHPNVVRAHRYLEANDTAYIVLEYVEGESLKAILDRRGRLSADEWRPWMKALLDGLAHVHSHGYLHRDIKPANIVVRSEDGEPVLIDFGSARLQHGDRTLTQVLTAGYAPIEQYGDDSTQGPAADIYALAAVSHRVLTGEPVASAPDRVLNDGYQPLADRVEDADARWLAAIDHGLSLKPEDRPQSVDDWCAELDGAEAPRTRPAQHRAASQLSQASSNSPPRPTRSSSGKRPNASAQPQAPGGLRHVKWAVPAFLIGLLAILWLTDGPIGDTPTADSTIRPPAPTERVATPATSSAVRPEVPQAANGSSPGTESSEETLGDTPYFTRGSHLAAVLRLQGEPSSTDKFPEETTLFFGDSRVSVTPDTQQVSGWWNSGQLKVRLLPGSNATDEPYFTRGSHFDDVLRLHGTPTGNLDFSSLGREDWYFGDSDKDLIDNDKVVIHTRTQQVLSWQNSSGQLKVRLLPGSNTTDEPYFTRGSHFDDVLRLHGTPKIINTISIALGHAEETWSYGDNDEVVISTRTGRVLRWTNPSGELKARRQQPATQGRTPATQAPAEVDSRQEVTRRRDSGRGDGDPIQDSTSAAPPKTVDQTTTEAADATQADLPYFTLGSHSDDVLRLQGTPTE